MRDVDALVLYGQILAFEHTPIIDWFLLCMSPSKFHFLTNYSALQIQSSLFMPFALGCSDFQFFGRVQLWHNFLNSFLNSCDFSLGSAKAVNLTLSWWNLISLKCMKTTKRMVKIQNFIKFRVKGLNDSSDFSIWNVSLLTRRGS